MSTTTDPCCLSYWFPLIESAGLPVPRTKFFTTDCELWKMFHSQTPDRFDDFIAQLRNAATEVSPSGPWFLRTGLTSAKHSWKETCFVTDLDKLKSHVFRIAEFSECADIMGLPYHTWVVREMLSTKPAFTAFYGSMPIVREFRFFIRDGSIEHIQPYWPEESIEVPSEPDWKDRFASLSKITPEEFETIKSLVLRASAAVPGFWSIDLLDTERGWFVTDMAPGERSYRYEPETPVGPTGGTR